MQDERSNNRRLSAGTDPPAEDAAHVTGGHDPGSAPGRCHGVVRDAATLQPVPGAEVRLHAAGPGPLISLRTEANGEYRVGRVPPGRYLLLAKARGFGHDAAAMVIEPGREAAVDLWLTPFTGGLAGTISAADDRSPVAGAEIEVRDSLGLPAGAAAAGDDGGYDLPDLDCDACAACVSAPGWQTALFGVQIPAGALVRADVALRRAEARLEGVVADGGTGDPLAGAEIVILDQDDRRVGACFTDDNGRFTAGGLAAGSFKVVARRPGYAAGWAGAIAVENGVMPVRLTLARGGGSAEGAVRVPDDRPVRAGITVFTRRGLPVAECLCDDRGRFIVPGLPPGAYYLRARSPGLAGGIGDFRLAGGEIPRVFVALLPSPAMLSGRITCGGRAVPGAVARIFDPEGRQLQFALSGLDGRYILHDLPAGEAYVVFSGAGLVAKSAPVALGAGVQARLDAEMEPGPCRILKPVAGTQGNPAANAQVRICEASSGRYLFTLLTNEEGFFWLRAWSPADPAPLPWHWH